MIRCGHCGGGHATVAEVRSCSGTPAPTLFDEPEAAAPTRRPRPPARPTPPATDHGFPGRPVELLAGPEALGRSVLVHQGQAAPAPWDGAPRVAVSAGRPDDEAMGTLQTAWSERRRIVIELEGDVPATDPVLALPWWELTPDLELEGERLRHLVTANAVDLRDPDRPRYIPLAMGVDAGGRPADDADLRLPDGTQAWCDGGPLAWLDEVIPLTNLYHGKLTPLGQAAPTAELADDQLEAVTHSGGGARIIAPAGSGKTRVLTERVRHLVADRHIHPGGVCLVAFNVRAREEMQERTTDLAGLEIRTLNSLALAICNGTGPFARPSQHRPVKVVDEHQVRRILDGIVKVRRQAMADPMAAWIEALGSSRLGLRSPAAVEADFGGDVKGFTDLAPSYVELLDRQGLVDFDQQILRAVDILLTDPPARAAARQVCRQLLVDEFQDLTPAHLLLIRLLAGPAAEVFGVGDDDQTIYGYSGASPEWLIGFADLFPGAQAHDLHVNYRCPPAVVEAAATLLTHNHRRVDKTIHAAPGRPTGDALTTETADDPAGALVAHVRALLDDGARPRDVAILTRVNATLLPPFVALGDAGIPTTKPLDPGFLDRTGIAAALAWLHLATAPAQKLPSGALATAARRPPRSLHPRVVDWIAEKRSIKDLAAMAGWLRDEKDALKVLAFAEHVELARDRADAGATTREVLEAIRDDIGLGRALDSRLDASRRAVDRSSHGDDLAALLSIADLHPEPATFPSWLADRLENLAHHRSGVRLSTVHRVKGREWPHVVVYEATAGLFPHRLSESTEEERRVFHVALTRGIESVHVISSAPASVFLAQMRQAADPGAPPEPERVRPTTARRSPPEATTIEIASLRERLRAWRTAKAKADAVPAYVIFSDATLYELAEYRPTTDAELLAIKGIGPAKLDKFGDELRAVLAG